MAQAEADAGGNRWSARYYELHITRTPHPSNTKCTDARRLARAAAATAATSPATTAARLTATAATASQLRRLASERITEQKGKRRRQHGNDDPDGATSESPALAEIDSACADHDASAASASGALPRAATAAPQAATAATAGPPKRQLTVAESFQRTTRRRADDPGAASRPLPDAPPLIPTTPADHPAPLPPPEPPPPAETQRPHRPPTPQPDDTTQQRTGQSRAHPERTRKCTTTDRTPQRPGGGCSSSSDHAAESRVARTPTPTAHAGDGQ